MIKQVIQYLIEHKITISTAESCTGGLIAKQITDIPGASAVFVGGVVSYSNEMKMKILGVKRETLEKYGAVSENTIREMLDGIGKITGSDITIAVSGIAGPGGGSAEKPVGTVYVGVGFRGKRDIRLSIFEGDRQSVRMRATEFAIKMVSDCLHSKI